MDDLVEVEFRDGKRWIREYLANMMLGLKTHTMTYDQAVEKANNKLLTDFVDGAQRRTVNEHLSRSARG